VSHLSSKAFCQRSMAVSSLKLLQSGLMSEANSGKILECIGVGREVSRRDFVEERSIWRIWLLGRAKWCEMDRDLGNANTKSSRLLRPACDGYIEGYYLRCEMYSILPRGNVGEVIYINRHCCPISVAPTVIC